MEKKQSSIEFAIEKITQFMTEDNDFEFGLIAEKLKAMHKEEIKDAVNSCGYQDEAEYYYNETFGEQDESSK